jgi:succinate dehydrogenase / fumarate reductase cytochrome b subunit
MIRRRNNYNTPKKRKSRQGVKRWIYSPSQGLSRTAFLFQRITGLGLTAYFLIHVFLTGNILNGKDAWETFLRLVETPFGQTGELLLLAALGFHGVNGLRLVLAETGYTLENPKRPDYPFKLGSFNFVQKSLLVFSIVAAILLFLLGYWFIFFRG